MKTWILVANASKASLYFSENLRNDDIKLLKEFSHPESREKGSDLVSDRPGHFNTDHNARSTYEKPDPKTIEAEVLARELVTNITHAYNTNEFTQLVLAASPHFYGLMHKHLAKISDFVHIPKDYTQLSSKELLEQLRKAIFV